MDYQIWIKNEYDEGFMKQEAGDLEAAKRVILVASKVGREVMLTVEVPFELELKIGEPGDELKKTPSIKSKQPEKLPAEEPSIEAHKDQTKQD